MTYFPKSFLYRSRISWTPPPAERDRPIKLSVDIRAMACNNDQSAPFRWVRPFYSAGRKQPQPATETAEHSEI
jgi:hypothetical protein